MTQRTIKFRAWDKDMQEMFLVGWIDLEKGEIKRTNNDFYKCTDATLMQFTGLTDKNGKEIYCSDLVGVSKEKYGEVYWNEDELSWWVEPIGEYPCEPLRGKGNAIEVLGNKYEGLA